MMHTFASIVPNQPTDNLLKLRVREFLGMRYFCDVAVFLRHNQAIILRGRSVREACEPGQNRKVAAINKSFCDTSSTIFSRFTLENLLNFYILFCMSYLVLARKYRPADFSQVVGQEHVTRTLVNAIKRDRVGHAYLFCGPRGVGKTSVARIFAKSLNCKKGPTSAACSECVNCKEIAEGRSMAVLEMDGASHNSVDNVRDLIETFRSAPPPGSPYKVYIIDEVHMLSTAAFNALLKSLEEPPPNTVFILATTEVHKIPETVLSRCQRHNFKALDVRVVRETLRAIAHSEKMNVEDEVFSMIARISEGSLRDAQTLLDRVQSYCDDKITAREASEVLSAVDRSLLFELSQAVFNRQPNICLELIAQAFARGVDTNLLLREFVSHWRELLIAAVGGAKQLFDLGVSDSDQAELLRQVNAQDLNDIQDLVQVAREGADQALRSMYPKYLLEALVVRMASREKLADFGKIIADLGSMAGQPVQAATGSTQVLPAKVTSSSERSVRSVAELEPNPINSEWRDFINFALQSNVHMLTEQLKRLSPARFSAGVFQVRGPELVVAYFKDKGNLERLRELLLKFKPESEWQIEILSGKATGGVEPGSVIALEQDTKKQKIQRETKNIASHPSIQNLKKVFPGSTIESVKIKAGDKV